MSTTLTHDEAVALCAARRARLLQRLGDGLLIVRTAPEVLRNGDVHHAHRPGSDFHYLTGFPEPGAVLVAWREATGRRGHRVRTVLFVRPKDKLAEIWHGRRHGVRGAVKHFGVDEARSIDEFWKALPDLLGPHERLFFRLGDDESFDRRLFDTFARMAFARRRRNVPAHPVLQDPGPTLAELRQIKDPAEIRILRYAADVTAEAHVAAMQAAHAGMTEYQVQEVLEGVFRRHGSRRNGYESIVASGANACILHYTENDRILRNGDLLLLDAGAEFDMYTADITRTWPVSGRFDDAQRAVYSAVLRAQKAAIRAVRPGRPWNAPHDAAKRWLTRGLVELGVLKGDVGKLVEKEAFKPWFMHGTSHWLGLDVHDAGRYEDADGKPIRLKPGMVLTVEPGLYFDARDRNVPAPLRGIGIRIEDDVLVERNGAEILTAPCPKEIRDVEAACAGSGAHDGRGSPSPASRRKASG